MATGMQHHVVLSVPNNREVIILKNNNILKYHFIRNLGLIKIAIFIYLMNGLMQ